MITGISLTQYWQTFNRLVEQYQQQFNPTNQQNIATAKQLIRIGLEMETRSLLSLRTISTELFELSKQFYPLKEVQLTHQTYLPAITNNETLAFAILYANHLANYVISEYRGNIWGKGTAKEGFEAKIDSTVAKAQQLRKHILAYCHENAIELSQEQMAFDYANPTPDYIQSLLITLTPKPAMEQAVDSTSTSGSSSSSNDQHSEDLSEDDSFSELELELDEVNQNLKNYTETLEQVKQQAVQFNQTLGQQHQTLEEALGNYEVQSEQWQSYSAFTKWLLQLVDRLIPVDSLRQYQQAEHQLREVQSNTLSSTEAAKQCSQLKQQIAQIENDIQLTQQHQQQLLDEKEQLQQQQELKVTNAQHPSPCDEVAGSCTQAVGLQKPQPTLAPPTPPRPKRQSKQPINASKSWCDFFDNHKNEISVAVAAAAIAAKAWLG